MMRILKPECDTWQKGRRRSKPLTSSTHVLLSQLFLKWESTKPGFEELQSLNKQIAVVTLFEYQQTTKLCEVS